MGAQASTTVLAREDAARILRENVGFEDPEAWIDFAVRHRFQRVDAVVIRECPACGAGDGTIKGQYVYYSTLVRLRECRDCTLLWADARPPLELIEQHFESAYKDRDYFEAQRHRIFEHLVDVISPLVPPGGAVLDVGGAQGDLMAHLEKRRSDVRCVVSDVSSSALEYATSEYGLEVRHGTLGDLATAGERYDVLVCSDALYYEADLQGFWQALRRVLRVGGSFVLRLPNRRWLIDLAQSGTVRRIRRSTSPECAVPFFNPEHLYVFGREFLQRTLTGLGFQEIRFHPSPILMPRGSRFQQQLCGVAFRGCAALHRLTGLLATPAKVVVARGFR